MRWKRAEGAQAREAELPFRTDGGAIRAGVLLTLVLAAGLAAGLGGCSAVSDNLGFGKPKDAPPTDANAYPKDYKPEIAAFMRTFLNNPTQVRDAFIAEPVLRPYDGAQRYITCVRYNPRDLSNRYQGSTTNLALFLGGRLNQFLPGDPALCGGLSYQRFPDIESLVP